MSPYWLLALAAALVAFGGLVTALESAIGSFTRADLERVAPTARFAISIRKIQDDSEAHINALSFVRTFSETTAAIAVTVALTQLIGELWLAFVSAALVMTAISFMLVGVSPRSVGYERSEALLRALAPLARLVRVLLGPLAGLLVKLGNRVTPARGRLGGVKTERELLSVIDEAAELDVVEHDDRVLMRQVLEFGDTVVRAVMVPRTDLVTVNAGTSAADAMALFLSSGVSRMPVFVDDIDKMDRVLYLRDVARELMTKPKSKTDVLTLARPAVLVPESMAADDLLRHFQAESVHVALVVDEYGGLAGIVTMEDVLEALVGDIADEHDHAEVETEQLSDGRYRVSARADIHELETVFDIEIEEDDVDTVGGLVTKSLGRLAGPGDGVDAHGLHFAVERTGRRGRLDSVLVHPIDSGDAADENKEGSQ